jgi:SAM-dependent methyltransferase
MNFPTFQQCSESVANHYNLADSRLTAQAQSYRSILAHYYRHMIPQTASVLEVGCGGAHLLKLLPNKDVCGVDVSPRQIDAAKKNLPHGTFQVQAAEELTLEELLTISSYPRPSMKQPMCKVSLKGLLSTLMKIRVSL